MNLYCRPILALVLQLLLLVVGEEMLVVMAELVGLPMIFLVPTLNLKPRKRPAPKAQTKAPKS